VANTNFVWRLTVPLYDVDVRGEVSCATLLRYFEETAMRGSAEFGFSYEWYQARGQFWVIRTMRMERACPPRYSDGLEIRTWVSSMRRVRSDRNYEVRRAGDGTLLARGIANWVYVDATGKSPTRIHPEIVAMFEPHDAPVLAPLAKLDRWQAQSPLFSHVTRRLAQYYEADSAGHVNNAVYVDWVEEAIRDALCELGDPPRPELSPSFTWFYRHSLEYVRPALPGDAIELLARLIRRGNTRGDWEVEVRRTETHETFLRAQTTTLRRDGANRPVRWQNSYRTVTNS
jgi:acyl-CoA thioester hydrolase